MAPSRQITLPFSFAYDTNGAFYIGQPKVGGGPAYEATPTISPFSQGGWNYAYPAMSLFGSTWQIPNNDRNYTCHGSFNYVFQDSRGGRHNLGLSVSPNVQVGDFNCNEGIQQDGEYTTGGEGSILATTSVPTQNTGTFPAVAVTDGDGTMYDFPAANPGLYGTAVLASTVVDRNGNQVTKTGTTSVVYQDSIGRTALNVSGLGANPDTVTVGGLSSPYSVYWTTASASFTDNMVSLDSGGQPCPTGMGASSSVVSKIVLPNGRQFTFTYDPTYGMVSKIQYPTGGYVRYAWGLNSQAEAGVWWETTSQALYTGRAVTIFPQ